MKLEQIVQILSICQLSGMDNPKGARSLVARKAHNGFIGGAEATGQVSRLRASRHEPTVTAQSRRAVIASSVAAAGNSTQRPEPASRCPVGARVPHDARVKAPLPVEGRDRVSEIRRVPADAFLVRSTRCQGSFALGFLQCGDLADGVSSLPDDLARRLRLPGHLFCEA